MVFTYGPQTEEGIRPRREIEYRNGIWKYEPGDIPSIRGTDSDRIVRLVNLYRNHDTFCLFDDDDDSVLISCLDSSLSKPALTLEMNGVDAVFDRIMKVSYMPNLFTILEKRRGDLRDELRQIEVLELRLGLELSNYRGRN